MEEETEHRLNNLPKVKIFSTLQVHHLILAFIIHNKYISGFSVGGGGDVVCGLLKALWFHFADK